MRSVVGVWGIVGGSEWGAWRVCFPYPETKASLRAYHRDYYVVSAEKINDACSVRRGPICPTGRDCGGEVPCMHWEHQVPEHRAVGEGGQRPHLLHDGHDEQRHARGVQHAEGEDSDRYVEREGKPPPTLPRAVPPWALSHGRGRRGDVGLRAMRAGLGRVEEGLCLRHNGRSILRAKNNPVENLFSEKKEKLLCGPMLRSFRLAYDALPGSGRPADGGCWGTAVIIN